MAKKLSRKKKGILWGLLIITILLLIVSIVAYSYLNSLLNLINRDNPFSTIRPEDEYFEVDENGGEGTGEKVNPEDVLWPDDDNGKVVRDKDIINILLIGQDKRPGEGRARSDSMMIATINKKDKSIKITSLMRDMYLQIPGYSDNRINAAYLWGGMNLLDQTIEKNFKIQIDGNVEVDFEGFMDGIDIIGGVPIVITKAEASHLNDQGFNLSAGEVNMNGELALAYARIRQIGNDHGRTERQRKVIVSAFEKMKGSSVPDIMALANKVFPCITTDLSNDQLINLGITGLTSNLSTIEQHRIPLDGKYKDAKVRKMQVLIPDLEANRQELHKIIYGE